MDHKLYSKDNYQTKNFNFRLLGKPSGNMKNGWALESSGRCRPGCGWKVAGLIKVEIYVQGKRGYPLSSLGSRG